MLESRIEAKLKKRVEEEAPGAACLKFVSPGSAGVPDRIILVPGGRVIFAETKQPGKKPTPRQARVHIKLRNLGFTVFGCVDSDEEIEHVVKYCKYLLKVWEVSR